MVFQLLAPAVDWLDYLSSSLSPLDLNDTEPVVLYAREYLQQVSDLINKTDRRSETPTSPDTWSICLTTELPPPPPCPPTHGPPVSPPVSLSSLVNNYMIWTLVQKTVASLDQRFENAQDKLLESLIGTKKVRFPGFPLDTVRDETCCPSLLCLQRSGDPSVSLFWLRCSLAPHAGRRVSKTPTTLWASLLARSSSRRRSTKKAKIL